jgi:histidyl-tRNA synthetase
MAPESVKLRKSLELAAKLSARYALIVGDQELSEGRYPLRDLARGEQKLVSREELLNLFAAPASATTATKREN